MLNNAELWKRREAAIPRGLACATRIFVDRAEGAELWDVEGRRHLDFAGGIGALNVGHRHPDVVAAVERQLGRYTHSCFQVAPYEPYVELAERLAALAPGDFPKKAVLFNSGAEAVENAVKIARYHAKRPAVVTFTGAFHGRTLFALSMTGKVAPYKNGFGPLPGNVFHAPFPMEYEGIGTAEALAGLEQVFKADVAPSDVAAIVIEPVAGEGGFHPAPADFLQALRRTCDEHGIVFVVDEVQSGFGRTGRMLAVEHAGVAPDLITVAKSLAGGLVLSGVVGRAEIMDAPEPGGLGGTYAGNPLGCAAALAVLDLMERDGLLQRAAAVGERVHGRFRAMAERPELDCIGDVRGLGAMCALELVRDRRTREAAPEIATALVERARERGLILLKCGTRGNTIRVLVPLVATDEQLEEGLDIIESSLVEAAQAASA